MKKIGLIEGFFGPEWSWQARHTFCERLPKYGGDTYLYAPKRDPFLRKSWTEYHPPDQWKKLKQLSATCAANRVDFGVGLSPFELHDHWNERTKARLKEKILKLEELDLKRFGLFFDDMRGAPDLAEKQIEIVEFVRTVTKQTILFCPTYYTDDPILDKVFGPRPNGYLEKIGSLNLDVEILWTGSKVIPKVITAEELDAVALILKRKPFIWDNYFANDGPRQCKFLKLIPLEGRTSATMESAAGWIFNPMNQPALSELVFASACRSLQSGDPAAFPSTLEMLAGPRFRAMVEAESRDLNELGLDKTDRKTEILRQLGPTRFDVDVRDWLEGKYVVGAECLTD